MELITNIAAVVGCVLSVLSLITLCSKEGRKIIYKIITRNTKELQEENSRQSQDIAHIKQTLLELATKLDSLANRFQAIEELSAQECRDTIKDIYYKYQATKKIPIYERKTADRTYKIYVEKFNGNSYATLLYTEICKWEIENTYHPELDNE